MPLPNLDLLNPVPAGDIMNDAYDKTNAAIERAVVDLRIEAGELVQEFNDGSTLAVPMPAGQDRILTGLGTSITGGPSYNIAWAAGTYQLLGNNYSIGAGSLPITAAHASLDRLDLLVVDDTATAILLAGVPAANPAAPTPAADQLVVALISIPAASAPVNLPNNLWDTTNLQPGTATGQTLVWNATANRWERNTNLTSTTTALGGGATTSVALYRTGTGSDGGSSITASASTTRLTHNNGAGFAGQVNLDSVSARILLQGNGATETTLDVDLNGGLLLKSATPTSTANKIYRSGSTLYFNGAPIGGSGWDGYADAVNIDSSDSPYTIAPTTPFYRVSCHADAALTLNLPAAPTHGQVILIKDRTYNAGSNNITINGNGNDIDNDSPYVIVQSGGAVRLEYDSGNGNWEITGAYLLPLLTPVSVYGGAGVGLVAYTHADARTLTSTGVKNVALVPSGLGDFVWVGFNIRILTVTGAGTPAAITAGWSSGTQILSTTAISPSAAGVFRVVPNSGFMTVIPAGTQLEIDVTTATTGYSAYDVKGEIIGYHVV